MTSALAHSFVTSSSALQPTRWMLFLHGILGSGSNWRSFARKLVEASPSWGAVLVDLREHGASRGMLAPHTVMAAASDLTALLPTLPGPVHGILGHSFGGKVAMEFIEQRAAPLELAWILDSTPSIRLDARGSETTLSVLTMLEAMPSVFPSRQHFIDAAIAAGQKPSLAQWLAMNLERDGDAMRLRLDLGAIRQMLEDYFVLDTWQALEAPPVGLRVHVVVGGRSTVFDVSDRQRLARVVERAQGQVQMHVLERAGHWVHVDDPEGLLALVRASM